MTKLGPHILGNSSQAAQWLRAGAPVVKLVGNFGLAPEAATLPHRPIVIGRFVETFLDPNRLIHNDPIAEARAYVANFLDTHIRLNPAVQAWEGPNECIITDLSAMRWYALFLREFARIIIESYKKVPVIGNWSVGNPDYPMWAEYRPALEMVGRYGGAILGRHNYAGPDQTTWPFLLLRHREDNRIFSEMGFPNLPVLITECGADGVPFGNPPGRAWKELYGSDAHLYYGEILAPFDAELRRDAYVLGATVFTSGDGWERHNIEGAVTDLLIANTRPSAPPIEPPPDDSDTHVVIASLLNVRMFPWVGNVTPPLVGQLGNGVSVRVFGIYKPANALHGWGCIDAAGNRWVNMRYLAQV